MTYQHPRPAAAATCFKPQPIDNLRTAGGIALMRHALAPKARSPIALLVRRRAIARQEAGFQSILVYCMGPPEGPRCHHWSAKKLDDLPEWDWYDISAHLKCTKCGSVGWVDTRPNWGEIVSSMRALVADRAVRVSRRIA